MDEQLIEMLRYIRLWGLLAHWDRYLQMAREKSFSHVRLLKYIIEEEYKIKKENSRKRRLSRAKIPEAFVMETFPFDRQPNLNKKKILNLYDSCEYLSKNQNVIWIGPTGTGKTGLATAFLIQAINQGNSGRFVLFPELIEMLYQAVADHSQGNVVTKFASYDCLLVDKC